MNPLDLLEAPLRAVLDFFHGIGFTWGWAIVMLTLVVRLILLPLFEFHKVKFGPEPDS